MIKFYRDIEVNLMIECLHIDYLMNNISIEVAELSIKLIQ